MSDKPNNGRILSVEDILGATTLEEKTVDIPELGGAVRIKAFNKGEQQYIRRLATDRRTGKIDTDKMELMIIVRGVIEPQFTTESVERLKLVQASVLDRIISAISEISGMKDEAVEAAEATFPAE